MVKRIVFYIIPMLLIADIVYSFIQHYHVQLDGDMAAIILPAAWYQQVLNDPFGFSAIFDGERYGGVNRFFCHWTLSVYYKHVPLLLQKMFDPITSVYLASALMKTGLQVFLIWVLSSYISGKKNIADQNFLIAAILITPLFQTQGYNGLMGIIEKSPTYTFFYPLPLSWLLLFFLPYFLKFYHNSQKHWGIMELALMGILIIVLPFSGPLIPPIALIICLLIGVSIVPLRAVNGFVKLQMISKHFGKMPKIAVFGLASLAVLSIYSFYLGKFNVENSGQDMPILSIYLAMPIGIYKQFSQKLGFPLLLCAIIFNLWYLSKLKPLGYEKLKRAVKYTIVFIIIYLALLPLGGVREYRPFIVRHDSMMPVTICMIYLFGATTLFLLNNIPHKFKRVFYAGVAVVMAVFTIADEPKLDHNKCERSALMEISKSEKNPVFLEQDCNVMAWDKITDPANSGINARLLKLWKITTEKKAYFQD